ncbi:mtpn [Symbiodinium sp. CCMP2592]|nr:mtpn [Symbiodinium sp. CCMP2592]
MALTLPNRSKAYFQAWNHSVTEVEALHAPGSTLCFSDGTEIAQTEPGVFREALQTRWDAGQRSVLAAEEVFVSAKGNICFTLVDSALPAPPAEDPALDSPGEVLHSPCCFELEFDPDGGVVAVSEYSLLDEAASPELAGWVARYFDCWNQHDPEAMQNVHAAESFIYLSDEVQYGPSSEDVVRGWEQTWVAAEAPRTSLRLFARAGGKRVIALRSEKGPRPNCEVLDFDDAGLCTSYIFADAERLLHRLATAIQFGAPQEVLQLVRRGLPLLADVELEVDGALLPGGTWLDLAMQLKRHLTPNSWP